MIFGNLARIFSKDIAIDLGTENIIVCIKNKGVVINEPTVVAIEFKKLKKIRVIAFGHQAKLMLGKTPPNIKVIEPMKDGVISDFEVVELIIKYIIKKSNVKSFIKPRVVICVPYGVTSVERNAFRDCAIHSGARDAVLVEEPMAAAIGAGIPVGEPQGYIIADIGAGTTEVAVTSLGGLVVCETSKIAGNRLDEAIVNYIKQSYNIVIGKRAAQELKINIGTAMPLEQELTMQIKGKNSDGYLTTIEINSAEIRVAISSLLKGIIAVIRSVLEVVPPDLASDIVDNGIILTGGGSLLRDLDKYIMQEVNLPVTISQEPLFSVAYGTNKVIEDSKLIELIARQ